MKIKFVKVTFLALLLCIVLWAWYTGGTNGWTPPSPVCGPESSWTFYNFRVLLVFMMATVRDNTSVSRAVYLANVFQCTNQMSNAIKANMSVVIFKDIQ